MLNATCEMLYHAPMTTPSRWSARWPLLAPILAVAAVVWAVWPKPVPESAALVGRWLREDGYVLEVKSAGAEGRAEVVYRNPQREKPIHVERATVTREEALKLFVELRDEGYPGSTYTLTYDPEDGRLKGEYYQAQEGSRAPVSFARAPPSP